LPLRTTPPAPPPATGLSGDRRGTAGAIGEVRRGGKLFGSQRLRSRTEHDLEMLEQTGSARASENYSAHLAVAAEERPFTLLDYFPTTFLGHRRVDAAVAATTRSVYAVIVSRKETLGVEPAVSPSRVSDSFRLGLTRIRRAFHGLPGQLNFDEFMGDWLPQMVLCLADAGAVRDPSTTTRSPAVFRPHRTPGSRRE